MENQLDVLNQSASIDTFNEYFPDYKIAAIERISEGFNGQVYKLTARNDKLYVGKFYFRHQTDGRDRLKTEVLSLRLLWEEGVRCIPRPLAVNQKMACVIYEFVDGKKIQWEQLTLNDLEQCTHFIEQLRAIARRCEYEKFNPASEACFSFQALVGNLNWRLSRLEPSAEQYPELCSFLNNELKPFYQQSLDEARKRFDGFFEDEISQEEKTLSPSDFGFHNALKRKDGEIVFLDFEYFGWDDPAKLIIDFLLHPAMRISDTLKKNFFHSAVSIFPNDSRLFDRIRRVYPFYGVKWCLIFLNEFRNDGWARRRFAKTESSQRSVMQNQQLIKSKTMLQNIQKTFKEFPYAGT